MVFGDEAVAVTSIIMVFGLAGLALTLLTYFLVQVVRSKAQREYRALAEHAVHNQRELLEASQEANRLLGQIERLLREVG